MKQGVHFVSTRSSEPAFTFEEALVLGLAPDGGLFIPVAFPSIPFPEYRDESYAEYAIRFLEGWFPDSALVSDLDECCKRAFSFPIELVPLSGTGYQNTYVLELFHGPTLSFKDYGARFMAEMLVVYARRHDKPITILVATSGDTGSAVADAFSGKENVRVILLYPKEQISPVQELQLTTVRPGVTACRVDGSFDDCQALVKQALQNQNRGLCRLTSANSINLGRLLPQSVYYAWATAQLGDRPIFHIPCGNLGNLTGGVMAYRTGAPIGGFVAAHNKNSYFPEFLTNADAESRPSERTISNAMDVGYPSNLERLRRMLSPEEMRTIISGVSISDADTRKAMRSVYHDTGYIADPHTAVAVASILQSTNKDSRAGDRVIVSTAHPAKFPGVIEETLGIPSPGSENLDRLHSLKSEVFDMAVSSNTLSELIER